jgi:hypothetical protein
LRETHEGTLRRERHEGKEATMTGEPHGHKEQDQEDIRKLAAHLADLIVNSDVPELRLDEFLAARRVCEPGTLCCFDGYKCTVPFFCDVSFRCVGTYTGLRTATQF